jgi:hypothetical protein
MRRLVLPLAAALLWAGAPAGRAAAETARVRSGDHGSFTRLVVELAAPADWRFGRSNGGYALDFGRADVALELGGVFRAIGRDRIADVSQDPAGRLQLVLGCRDCHATALSYRDSWIVIDVAGGPPPPGSPFEEPLAGGAVAGADAGGNQPGGAAPRRSPPPRPAPPRPAAARLAAGVNETAGEAGAMTAATEATEVTEAARPEVPGSALPAAGSTRESGTRAGLPDGAVPHTAARRGDGAGRPPVWLDPSASPLPAPAIPGAWDPGRGPGAPAAGREEGPPVRTERDRLLEELARAAAQGLLDADLPALDRARRAVAAAAAPVEAPAPAPPPEPAPSPADHVRIEAETSVDRDTRAARRGAGTTPEGRACIDDSELDIASWGGTSDPSAGLAERRGKLLGEFDRPEPDSVLGLARYYLYLGFGAEARATLSAFGSGIPAAGTLAALADLIDGQGARGPGPFAGQASCPGRASLWAVVAEGVPKPPARPDARAVIAAFAELPPHLRRHLGPDLAATFLEAGDTDTALALRDATLRAPGAGAEAFARFDAALGLAEGDSAAAAGLAALAGGGDTAAVDAYAAYLEGELAAGRVPDRGSVTAAALAFEIAGTDEGRRLADAALDALLAEGDFEGARQEILRRAGSDGAADTEAGGAGLSAVEGHGGWLTDAWRRYADAITRGAPDGEFLRQAFAAREPLAASLPEGAVSTALAVRLAGLGFADEALRYLPGEPSGEPARLALAEVYLETDRPAEAFGTLAGLRGPAAERLRARALLALGDAHGAAELFAAAGDTRLAEGAALRAGAWERLEGSEDETLRALAEARSARPAPPGTGRVSAADGAVAARGERGRLPGAADESSVATSDAERPGRPSWSPGGRPGAGSEAEGGATATPVPGDGAAPVRSAADGPPAGDLTAGGAVAAPAGDPAPPGGGAATAAPFAGPAGETGPPDPLREGRVARARSALQSARAARALVQSIVSRDAGGLAPP